MGIDRDDVCLVSRTSCVKVCRSFFREGQSTRFRINFAVILSIRGGHSKRFWVDSAQNRRREFWTESDHPVVLRRHSRGDSACRWLRMARPSRSRSRSGDSGAKCSSGVAFAKATILTIIALDARFPNKSESAFGVEAGFESSSESPRIAYCDRPYYSSARSSALDRS